MFNGNRNHPPDMMIAICKGTIGATVTVETSHSVNMTVRISGKIVNRTNMVTTTSQGKVGGKADSLKFSC